MPPKAAVTTLLTAATTLGLGGDTSIIDDLQPIIRGQLQEIVDQLIDNNATLKERLNSISIAKIKLPLIKRFIGERSKLKGFLT
jgi:hypothetical protein